MKTILWMSKKENQWQFVTCKANEVEKEKEKAIQKGFNQFKVYN
jgi:hypothetical protein